MNLLGCSKKKVPGVKGHVSLPVVSKGRLFTGGGRQLGWGGRGVVMGPRVWVTSKTWGEVMAYKKTQGYKMKQKKTGPKRFCSGLEGYFGGPTQSAPVLGEEKQIRR